MLNLGLWCSFTGLGKGGDSVIYKQASCLFLLHSCLCQSFWPHELLQLMIISQTEHLGKFQKKSLKSLVKRPFLLLYWLAWQVLPCSLHCIDLSYSTKSNTVTIQAILLQTYSSQYHLEQSSPESGCRTSKSWFSPPYASQGRLTVYRPDESTTATCLSRMSQGRHKQNLQFDYSENLGPYNNKPDY